MLNPVKLLRNGFRGSQPLTGSVELKMSNADDPGLDRNLLRAGARFAAALTLGAGAPSVARANLVA